MRHRSPGSFSSGSQVLRSPLGFNFDAREERFSFCGPGAEIYSGTWKSGDPSLSRHITSPRHAWSLFHAAFPQRRRPLFVGLGWSPSSSQVACVFTPSHSCDCQGQRDLSGRVCGEKLPTLREQRKVLCLEPIHPWPVASACFLVLPFPAALVSRKLKELSMLFLWRTKLMAMHFNHSHSSLLLGQGDGKCAKVLGSKFDNLSSICRTHLVEETNQLPTAVLWFSHICLYMGTTNKQMSK